MSAMKNLIILFIFIIPIFILAPYASADEIHLANGCVITGVVVGQNKEAVSVRLKIGLITFNNEEISQIIPASLQENNQIIQQWSIADTPYKERLKERLAREAKLDDYILADGHDVPYIEIDGNYAIDVDGILKSFLELRDSRTGLAPSHWGHPGYENLAFLYDEVTMAMILDAAGYKKEAEKIMDYFANRIYISLERVCNEMDSNCVYGVIKLYLPENDKTKKGRSLVNAFDITSDRPQGRGLLEFFTTPGPLSFTIFAMLNINSDKYLDEALILGETLLLMQREDGGVIDGDRAPDRVHTEPHNDAVAAFLMLYETTGDEKWLTAAEKAAGWFFKYVYHSKQGIIDQGIWKGIPSTIFATDCYSWIMAGPLAEHMPAEDLKRLTSTMLENSLVEISVPLPNKRKPTVILCDFTNADDFRAEVVRGGFHPMGSMEWTGGVILALQKNAVRLWQAEDFTTAVFYKGLAEALLAEAIKCFYKIEGLDGWITFYATGQGIEVGPFGSIKREIVKGWKTPYYNSTLNGGDKVIEGGSPIGAWPLLPYLGKNPFILNDNYKEVYNQIPLMSEDIKAAREYLHNIAKERSYFEQKSSEGPKVYDRIVEPWVFNQKMWKAYDAGRVLKSAGKEDRAEKYFSRAILWAKKTVNNRIWLKLARRDNEDKALEYGGIIDYPWGATFDHNNHPIHVAIWRYPLLNEVSAAMVVLVYANYELGNIDEAKLWIAKIIDEVPLHQIADVGELRDNNGEQLVQGYWNALVSWEYNPGGFERDEQVGLLYQEVLKEKGLETAAPEVVYLPEADEFMFGNWLDLPY
jgi:hypothetical protein